MSISEQIARLQQLKERLRTKLTALKLASEENTLEECVAAVESIADNRAVSQKLDTTTASYTVPAGYHNGSGTVSVELEEKTVTANGVVTPTAGKVLSKITVNVENAPTLQEKTAVPSKEAQEIVADEGYDGLSKVSVQAIPANFADVTGVTVSAADVLTGKVFVDSTGAKKSGEMANNAAVSATINGLDTTSYVIPAGYHNGSGTVTLTDDIENALAAI
ncbi:MAG: hypothetical protein Q3W84_00210 [Eubacteriales bacterium]|nr:hypothetical protein [Eubacteriales bacterium]